MLAQSIYNIVLLFIPTYNNTNNIRVIDSRHITRSKSISLIEREDPDEFDYYNNETSLDDCGAGVRESNSWNC